MTVMMGFFWLRRDGDASRLNPGNESVKFSVPKSEVIYS